MENVRIYNEEESAEGLKPVNLRLVRDGTGAVELQAVDNSGEEVATLISFECGEAVAPCDARDELERQGYDTSFADWRMMGDIQVS